MYGITVTVFGEIMRRVRTRAKKVEAKLGLVQQSVTNQVNQVRGAVEHERTRRRKYKHITKRQGQLLQDLWSNVATDEPTLGFAGYDDSDTDSEDELGLDEESSANELPV